MKHKKIIAITLCVGLLASSFSGYLTGYSKNEKNKLTIKKYDSSLDNSGLTTLPSVDLVEIESEAIIPENTPYHKNTSISDMEGEIMYKGTKVTLNPEGKDVYSIGKEEIEAMMQEGYSVVDIFEADKISNETGIAPEILLEKKTDSSKSLAEIKKEILEENREKTYEKLKDTYKKEYEKLKNKKLKETEIMNLLAYADVNNIKVTDELIVTYQKSGEKLFQSTMNESKVNQGTKEKYQLSDAETKGLTQELMSKLELLSQKTGKPVEEMVKAYYKGNEQKNK
ncbi:hypothetical protein acsn021_02400 [Anaerocolumna cellulosilytica]|jgi:hypothetical protein|uniref:Uncharacterized protein n=1 Tax=Anaerocolumna cellulosilytica TaxID=433286 RepID=A0A6S6R0A9_9FIRM|nr:hypothetical protein [Anaerocolumna cellulosilytica]MBB5196929.1 hypothetical protein [Anaerocolumna cellulosilytica]BCJ92671.1 hypothetical protein acsn021_02400 [Anaerocolumna cellulosilytica]